MAKRARADAELVRRGLARSRDEAGRLISEGRVWSGRLPVAKPATAIEAGAPLHVTEVADEVRWASRGAHKLIGALDRFAAGGLDPAGGRWLDAGASTGGFTDVLLSRGARAVVAADVGYGQLVWRLQTDARVRVLDRTNVRSLDSDAVGGPVDGVVADLSFISLRLVLPAFAECVRTGGDLVPMVKPQFEVGRERVGRGGVVRDAALRAEAVAEVAKDARSHGLVPRGAVASPLPGPSGNVEFFLWMRKADAAGAPCGPGDEEIDRMVRAAVEEGPR